MKDLRRIVRVRFLALFVGVPIILASCMMPPGNNQAANPNVDVPDPTMITYGNIFGEFIDVYGTGSCGEVPCMGFPTLNIPSYSDTYPPAGQAETAPVEALPGPLGINWFLTWSPSVIYTGGEYVMAMTVLLNSSQACIGFAISTQAFYSFTAQPSYLQCLPYGPAAGLLDPQFFLDSSTGDLYLLFSIQVGPRCTNGGAAAGTGSSLWVERMSSSGLGVQSGTNPQELLSWSQAASIKSLPPVKDLGSTPCLENPNIINDANSSGGNPYDLLFSIGTWKQSGTYYTGEVDCGALNDTNLGCGLDPSGGAVFNNQGGGASTLFTNSSSGNYVMYSPLTFVDGIPFRADWVGGPTVNCDPVANPEQCT